MTSPNFAILVALDKERDEVLKVFDSEPISSGRFSRPAWRLAPGDEFSGILYHINDQGLQSALGATTELLRQVGQDLDLVVNIGVGGIIADDDLKIGDVVCATRAYEIDYNEKYVAESEDGRSLRLPGPKVFDSENSFKWNVKYFDGKSTDLTQWQSVCEGTLDEFDLDKGDIGVPNPAPSIEVGPLASSGAVVTDKSTEEGFSKYITSRIDRNILAIDEESAGVLRAVKEWNAKHGGAILSGILRGMSDFADENKAVLEEGRQSYAAYTAASLFNYLLENGWIDTLFEEELSFDLPNSEVPEEMDSIRSIVSQLRGQVEGRFDVHHLSLGRSGNDFRLRDTSTIPVKRMLSETPAIEHLLDELVNFEYSTQAMRPEFKSDSAAEIFGTSLHQDRNILHILNEMRKWGMSEESVQNVAQNVYNMRLRYDVHTSTTVCEEFGGTTLDSFITRSWEKKVIEEHPWQPIGASPKEINEQEATFNVVLERFDSYGGELEYDTTVRSVNGNVSIDDGLVSERRETIGVDNHTHLRFTIDSHSDLTTMRFDSEAFPWHVADILELSVSVKTDSKTELDGTGYSDASQAVVHIPLPGADEDSGDILIPSVE